MPTIGSFSHAQNVNALGTYTYTLTSAGIHTVGIRINDFNGLTGLTITIKQNGTTILTVPVASANQAAINALVTQMMNVSDTISWVIASSNAADSLPNNNSLQAQLILRINPS